MNPEFTAVAEALYAEVRDEVVPVSSTRVAEASKLLENIYRAVNIALVNELKVTFDHMGIDVWEVIEAAKTKPFGFQAFYPGPGLGGHCIPLDPFYLSWKAAEHGVWTRFIDLAGEINTGMPAWVISKVSAALSDEGKGLKGAKVLILGLSYKKGDMSPVGPRPPLPREVENYTAEHCTRLRGLPGITGLWQMSGPSKRWSGWSSTTGTTGRSSSNRASCSRPSTLCSPARARTSGSAAAP